MIVAPSGVHVLVATKPVDFRKAIDGLAALVQEQLRFDPYLCVGRRYVAEAAEGRALTGYTLLPPPHNLRCFPVVQDRVFRSEASTSVHGLALPEVPFGGIKDPGFGSEGGLEAIEAYLVTKFVVQAPIGGPQHSQG